MAEKSKFNLKTYQEIDTSMPIGKRLDEENKDEKIPNQIEEAQLDDQREPEATQTVEGLLEDARTGSSYKTTEAALDDDKALFGNKFRNAEAYQGDINKLEEKRLSEDPSEDQPYEDASVVPEKMRWWEKDDSPDGLKLT